MARAFGSVLHLRSLSPASTHSGLLRPQLSGALKLVSSRRLFPCRAAPPSREATRRAVSASAVATKQGEKEQFPADVQVTETKLPRSCVRLNVEVPPSVSRDCYRKVLQEFAKQAKVPGFRPGKSIPENILINYVGKQHVQRATIEAILKKTLPHATSVIAWQPYLNDGVEGQPWVEEGQGLFGREVYLICLNIAEPLYHGLIMRTIGLPQQSLPVATLSNMESRSKRFLGTREIDWIDFHRSAIEHWHRGGFPVTSTAVSSDDYLERYRRQYRARLQEDDQPEEVALQRARSGTGGASSSSAPPPSHSDEVADLQLQLEEAIARAEEAKRDAEVRVKGRALKDAIQIVTKFSEMDKNFSLQVSFRYDVLVDVAPEVKWISENGYKNLKIVVEIDNTITAVTAAELELRRRHKSLGSLRIVTGRGLQVGDLVVLNIFATTVKEDESEGEKIPSAERKDFHLDTEESDNLLPGFLDSIQGIRQGETRSFVLSFPDSWEQQNLQGVRAQFTVECKELFYRDLPQLDDSLAEKLIPGCNTLDQVKDSILQRCREVEQTAREQATDNAILDQLCKIVEVDIPQSLYEEQGRELYGAQLLHLQASRRLDEHQLASLSSKKSVNDYLESQRDKITNVIKQMLAIGEIFRCENLQYSTEELVKEVENCVAEFKQHNQEYDEERVRQQVQEILEGAKVLEWLRENTDIQYTSR